MKQFFLTLPGYPGATLDITLRDGCYDGWCQNTRPMLVIFPGGGYHFCSDREADPIASAYLASGFSTCILRYSVRTSPDEPALGDLPLQEAAETVRYVRAHASDWSIDPDKITVIGFSAGGHLAASLGVHWNRPSRLPSAGASCRPNGLILAYPVITAGELTHRGSIENLTGIEGFSSQDSLYNIPSYVGADMPPAFIWHTFADELVPVENSLELASAMRRAGRPFALHIFPCGQHGLSTAEAEVGGGPEDVRQWLSLSVSWLQSMGLK